MYVYNSFLMIMIRWSSPPSSNSKQRERSSKKSSPTTAQSNFVFVLSLFLLLAVLLKTLTAVERHNIPSSPVVHAGIGFTHFQFVAHCFLLLWTYWWFFGFGFFTRFTWTTVQIQLLQYCCFMIVTASSNSNPGTTGIIQNIVSDNSTKHFVFLLGQCLLFSYSVENKFAAVFSFVPFAEMFVMETPGLARIRFLLLIHMYTGTTYTV